MRHKQSIIISGLFSVLLLLSAFRGIPAFAEPTSNTSPAVAAQKFTSPQGYTIDIPNDWTIEKTTSAMVDLLAMGPQAGTAATVNVNIQVDSLHAAMTAQEYYGKSEKTMKAVMQDFAEISAADFSGKGTCWKMVYQFKANDKQWKDCMYIFVGGLKAYILTATATPETFANSEPVFDRIAHSFSLTNSTEATHTAKSARDYSIDIPKDWTIIQPKSGIIDLQAIAPRSDKTSPVNENINIVVEPLNELMTARKYYEASKTMMQGVMQDFTEESAGDFSGNGTCWKMVGQFTMNNVKLKDAFYIYSHNFKGYVITATATPESFAKFEPIFDNIARSFHLN